MVIAVALRPRRSFAQPHLEEIEDFVARLRAEGQPGPLRLRFDRLVLLNRLARHAEVAGEYAALLAEGHPAPAYVWAPVGDSLLAIRRPREAAAVLEQEGSLIITADHGNADMMVDPVTGEPFTQHTTNEVPFILVSDAHKNCHLDTGILADIAPTILDLADLPQPDSMTGRSLIQREKLILSINEIKKRCLP